MNQITASCSQCFGIADFRETSFRQLNLLDINGGINTSQTLKLSGSDPRDPAVHTEVVAQCSMQPKAVALIVVGHEPLALHAECISFDPLPILLVTEVIAAARVLPDWWTKFQLINVCLRALWLLEKREGELVSATFASWDQFHGELGDALSNFALMGFAEVAVLGDATAFPKARALSSNDLVLGARICLQERLNTEGLGLSWNRAGLETLSVVARRKVSYHLVHTEKPVFSCAEPALAELAAERPVLFVVDSKIDWVYGAALNNYSSQMMNSAGIMVFDAVEARKNVVTVARICKYAAELGFPRHGVLVAVGGGVTLDVVGMAAAVYRRGIGYLRVPTTLVGLIDAGIGIKQGVNFLGKKNLVGAFYPPIAAVHDINFLETLPLREISCGLAEIAKIAVIKDQRLFELLEEHGQALCRSRLSAPIGPSRQVLLRSALLMLEELQANFFEENLCRPVDFGHTFSPIIEAQSGYTMPHGYAVAFDMLLSTAIAVNQGLCRMSVLTRLSLLFRCVQLPSTQPPCSVDVLMRALRSARQHRGGNLNLVVPIKIGEVAFVQEVSRVEIEAALVLVDAAHCQELLEMHADPGL